VGDPSAKRGIGSSSGAPKATSPIRSCAAPMPPPGRRPRAAPSIRPAFIPMVSIGSPHPGGLGPPAAGPRIPRRRRQRGGGVYPYFTFAPTEFGYFRLGYEYSESDQLEDKLANRVWLQYDFSIGPHAAHAF